MAILGRTYVNPIIVRSDPADFATVKNPVTTVIVAAPYARTWFNGQQATISQSQTADFATVKNPVTLVQSVAPVDRIRLQGQQAYLSRSSLADAAVVTNPVRAPIVVVPQNQRPTFTLPTLTRTSLEDTKGTQPIISAISSRPQIAPVLLSRTSLEDNKGTQPLIVTSPQRPGLGVPTILTRSNPATFATIPGTPPIVYTPIVPQVWFRGYTLALFPRGDFIPPPPPPGSQPVFCALDPHIDWYASSPVTDWYAGGPVTGWTALDPEEECC